MFPFARSHDHCCPTPTILHKSPDRLHCYRPTNCQLSPRRRTPPRRGIALVALCGNIESQVEILQGLNALGDVFATQPAFAKTQLDQNRVIINSTLAKLNATPDGPDDVIFVIGPQHIAVDNPWQARVSAPDTSSSVYANGAAHTNSIVFARFTGWFELTRNSSQFEPIRAKPILKQAKPIARPCGSPFHKP